VIPLVETFRWHERDHSTMATTEVKGGPRVPPWYSLSAAMIAVAVATLVAPDRFAPIDVMVSSGFDGYPGDPHVHLGACHRDERSAGGTECGAGK
jgi:hypothetical protein